MLNARKREASDPLLPTRQPKQPRVEESTPPTSGGLAARSELTARWSQAIHEFFSLTSDTIKALGSSIAPSTAPLSRPLRSRRSPPSLPLRHRHRSVHTIPRSRSPFSSRSLISSESRSLDHQIQAEPNTLPSSLQSDQYPMKNSFSSTRDSGSLLKSPSTSGVTSAPHPTVLPPLQTVDDLLADSVQTCRRAEEISNTLNQRRSKEHIFARKHKTKVREDRIKDREAVLKELFEIKRANGFKSSYEDFKSYIDFQARLQHLDARDTLSPSASLTDLRLIKEEMPSPLHRHSFSGYADIPFLESAKNKLLRTLASKPTKPFSTSAYEYRRQEARKKDEEIERRFRPSLPKSLPSDADKLVDGLLAKKGVISKVAREQVCDKDISRLLPCQWLNDELINFYGAMLLERSEAYKENPGANGRKKPLNVHFFNTFFWSKLLGEGYERARLSKWTKKIDLFSKDIILIPINHNNSHWTGAAINFRRKRIESYDSMNLDRHQVFKGLRHYLDLEHQNKKKKPFDFTGWVNYGPDDIPQQENGYDCGVFTCQFLESLSRGEETFNFSQRDMAYLRRRMIWEIGHARFLDVP